MAKPPAHRQPSAAQIERARQVNEEFDLFFGSIDLVLAHETMILAVDEYALCRPAFSHYGVYSGRPVTLAALLIGWRCGLLRESCVSCAGGHAGDSKTVLVYFFGGMGSGVCWSGYCLSCRKLQKRYSNSLLWERMAFMTAATEQIKDWTETLQIEHYTGHRFSFGEPPMVPCETVKVRKVKKQLIEAVSVKQLVTELSTGRVRPPTPRERSLVPDRLIWKRPRDGIEEILLG